ncbi:hypothetical protein GWI33_008145 [Rhynchophorus ferrugineus]|uniref:Uncharacterized protein n=1 Tax=Rhynchophorus ferrugineus TaxID=354439 RepID=A0A834MG36_RHYFE|nr:hypothetical protein GWI33_008145 [Rhynchophorus ferrugineus]
MDFLLLSLEEGATTTLQAIPEKFFTPLSTSLFILKTGVTTRPETNTVARHRRQLRRVGGAFARPINRSSLVIGDRKRLSPHRTTVIESRLARLRRPESSSERCRSLRTPRAEQGRIESRSDPDLVRGGVRRHGP